MPTFDVTVQGKKYHIEIPDPGASPLQVVVDGQTFDVEVAGTGLSAQPAQRAEPPRPAPEPPALPPMPRVNVTRPAVQADPNLSRSGHEVTAPMPGTILSVDVKVGETVTVGQAVCVLEAMKMKNPIRVSYDGIVSEIAVTAGQNVAFGDILVRLA